MVLKKLMNGKTSLTIMFILLTLNLIGQEYRAMYNYTFASDSTNLNFIENEIMVLDIDKTESIFYSYPKFKYDSIVIEKNSRNENIMEGDRSKILFSVSKKHLNNEIIYRTKLGYTNYAVLDNQKIDWKLENEQKTIKGIEVQKASTHFGGRTWFAWYSKDIPIFDGPYKFSGLPGLILEIQDIKHQHKFEFIGIQKNISGVNNFYKILMTKAFKEQKMNNKEFNKEWKEFKKDPAKDLKFSLLNSKLGFKINYDGKDYSVSDMIRNTEETERSKLNKNNNFIELTLYQ